MPGVLDFLFEGRPPASVNTYGQTVENIPKWMSDYTQGLIGRANVIAAEPYQAYEGPRIAGFSPDQLSAFDLTRQNVGRYEPTLGRAGELFQESSQINPLNAAAPFVQEGAGRFPEAVDQYMDPFIQNVLNRQEELSSRNLNENLIPALQHAFVGSGSFGGDRMEEIAGRVIRDTGEALQGQQLGALSQAYGQAGNLFGADQARQLQAGMVTGNLAGQTADIQQGAGQQFGALGEAIQRMGFGDAAGLETIGAQQRGLDQGSLDLAYRDFIEQRDYPRQNIDWMSSVVRGLPQDRAVTTTDTGPASIYQPSPLAQIGSLYSTYRGVQG